MLRRLATVAPPVAFLLVLVLLAEPPAFRPADRLPTLRVLIGGDVDLTPGSPPGRVIPRRVDGPATVGVEPDECSEDEEAVASTPGVETEPCDPLPEVAGAGAR